LSIRHFSELQKPSQNNASGLPECVMPRRRAPMGAIKIVSRIERPASLSDKESYRRSAAA
jgi:hypothetical protein